MDINTNVSQQTAISLTVLKAGSVRTSVDRPTQSGFDTVGNEEVNSVQAGKAGTAKAKENKGEDDLKQAVDDLNGYIQNVQRDLHFSIDKESGTMIVKVIDSKSEKVIRQMPTEETLRLARHLAEDKQDAAFNIFSSRA